MFDDWNLNFPNRNVLDVLYDGELSAAVVVEPILLASGDESRVGAVSLVAVEHGLCDCFASIAQFRLVAYHRSSAGTASNKSAGYHSSRGEVGYEPRNDGGDAGRYETTGQRAMGLGFQFKIHWLGHDLALRVKNWRLAKNIDRILCAHSSAVWNESSGRDKLRIRNRAEASFLSDDFVLSASEDLHEPIMPHSP